MPNNPTDNASTPPSPVPGLQIQFVAKYQFSNVAGGNDQERIAAALQLLHSHESGVDVANLVADEQMIATVPTADGGQRQYAVNGTVAEEVVQTPAGTEPPESLLPMVLVSVDHNAGVRISTDSPLLVCLINAAGDEMLIKTGLHGPSEFPLHLANIFRLAKLVESATSDDERRQATAALSALLNRPIQ